MRRFTGLAAAAALGAIVLGQPFTAAQAEDVTIKMWAWADRSGPLRTATSSPPPSSSTRCWRLGLRHSGQGRVYEGNADGFDDRRADSS